jgi:hypothetical protein
MKKTKQPAARSKAKRKTANVRTKRTPIKKQPNERERTAVLKAAFIKHYIGLNCNVTETCKKAHIGRQTYYDWISADSEFKAAADVALESLVDHVEDQLHSLIDGGEPSAVYFFLKCKAKHRGYVEKTEYGGNINLTHNLSISDLKKSMDSYKK